jgi:hypothetical protein
VDGKQNLKNIKNNHMELLLSIFSGGLFLIDLLLLGGAAAFFRAAYKASKSGSVEGGSYSNPKITEKGNMPIYQINLFWFGVALVAAEIVTVMARIGDL